MVGSAIPSPEALISGIGVLASECRILCPWDGIVTDGENSVGRLNIAGLSVVSPRNVGVRNLTADAE